MPQLTNVHVDSPIEQHMVDNAGRYRQQIIETRKAMSVQEWAELCAHEELRALSVLEAMLKVKNADDWGRRVPKRRVESRAKTAHVAMEGPEAAPTVIKVEEQDNDIPEDTPALGRELAINMQQNKRPATRHPHSPALWRADCTLSNRPKIFFLSHEKKVCPLQICGSQHALQV